MYIAQILDTELFPGFAFHLRNHFFLRYNVKVLNRFLSREKEKPKKQRAVNVGICSRSHKWIREGRAIRIIGRTLDPGFQQYGASLLSLPTFPPCLPPPITSDHSFLYNWRIHSNFRPALSLLYLIILASVYQSATLTSYTSKKEFHLHVLWIR